jgi:hypothetical protein
MDQHEQAYREKWLQLQSSMEATVAICKPD